MVSESEPTPRPDAQRIAEDWLEEAGLPVSRGWVLTCLLCELKFTGTGPMPHTTQHFMCDDCTVKVMEAQMGGD